MSDLWRVVVTLMASVIVGLLFLIGGTAGLAFEITHPPSHTAHVWMFFGSAVFGALMLPGIGGVMLRTAKAGLDVAGPYLPFGRRAYDNDRIQPPKE